MNLGYKRKRMVQNQFGYSKARLMSNIRVYAQQYVISQNGRYITFLLLEGVPAISRDHFGVQSVRSGGSPNTTSETQNIICKKCLES